MAVNEFLDLMTQTVTLTPFSSSDKYGERSFGTAKTIKARVADKEERIPIASGEIAIARGTVWLGELVSPVPSTKDQLTLPDGSTPEILAVRKFPDQAGDHHQVIFFK